MRSISAALIRASLWFSTRSCATSANSSSRSRGATSGNGNPGEGLVDVHAIELFSVGVETHHPVVAQKSTDLFQGAAVFQLQAPEEAVAAEGQQQFAEARLQAVEQVLQVRQNLTRCHHRQHDAV